MRPKSFGTKSLSLTVTEKQTTFGLSKFFLSDERGSSYGPNSVGTKFLSLTVAEKQTTSGLTEFFDFPC